MNMLIYILVTVLIAAAIYTAYLLLPQWDGWLGRMKVKYRGKKVAVLSFDDGPDEPWTTEVLDILKNENIKANFFVLGEKVLENPDLVLRMKDEGHEIGNHTFSHRKLFLRSARAISEDLISTSNIIQKATDELPNLLRTPHGFKRPGIHKILRRLGLQFVPWTKGVWDTDGSDANRIFKRFCKRFADLEILLLHDGSDTALTTKSRDATVRALPKIIDEYRKRGYIFKRIRDL